MTSVRASARTNFYPCWVCLPCTKCNMRAKCAGKPLLSARPFSGNGHVAVSRATIAYTALYWFARYMRLPLNPDQQKRSNAAKSGASNASGASHA